MRATRPSTASSIAANTIAASAQLVALLEGEANASQPRAKRKQGDDVGHQSAHRNAAQPLHLALTPVRIEARILHGSHYSGERPRLPRPASEQLMRCQRKRRATFGGRGISCCNALSAAPRLSEEKNASAAAALWRPRLRRRRIRNSAENLFRLNPAARHITEIGSSEAASRAPATASGLMPNRPPTRAAIVVMHSASASSASTSSSASNPSACRPRIAVARASL